MVIQRGYCQSNGISRSYRSNLRCRCIWGKGYHVNRHTKRIHTNIHARDDERIIMKITGALIRILSKRVMLCSSSVLLMTWSVISWQNHFKARNFASLETWLLVIKIRFYDLMQYTTNKKSNKKRMKLCSIGCLGKSCNRRSVLEYIRLMRLT